MDIRRTVVFVRRCLRAVGGPRLPLACACLCLALAANGQIVLRNPGFEGEPHEDQTPAGWFPWGNYTTPDILPGPWEVVTRPFQGRSFVGLTARVEGTWEMLGQELPTTLKKNECYRFSVHLARSTAYAGYNNPVRFRVWGGNAPGDKKQLLADSEPVAHTEWRSYEFYCFPEADYRYLLLEPAYKDGKNFPYNGNILIDNFTAISTCHRVALPEKTEPENPDRR
jgi:hypothetical protein